MADTKRVYRYEVPVDSETHLLPDGKVVLVDSRKHAIAEVWIEFPQTGGLPDLPVRVYGTGHDVPSDSTEPSPYEVRRDALNAATRRRSGLASDNAMDVRAAGIYERYLRGGED